MNKRRKFTSEFKAQIVLEILSGSQRAAEICRRHKIKPQLLNQWKKQLLENAATVFKDKRQNDPLQARIGELERVLGQKTLELEIAKKASNILHAHLKKREASL